MSRPTRVLLVSPDFLPTRGGAELRFRRYLPGLTRRGVEVEVLSGTPVARKLTPADLDAPWYRLAPGEVAASGRIGESEFRQVRLPDGGASRRSAVLHGELLRLCRTASRRPGVVQFLSSLPPSARGDLSRLRADGVPTAFAFTLPGKEKKGVLREALRRFQARRLYGALTCLIASSAAIEALLRQMGVRTRVAVIPNGVDLQQYRPPNGDEERRRLRADLGIAPESQVVVNIGAVHPRKGTDLLLEAWLRLAATFPHLHLYLVGMRHDQNAPELAGFRAKLQELLAASGAAERVHFVGYAENVAEYLRAADLFVFPSRREGMGNVVLEAMASAVTCVLTPFVGFPADFGERDRHYLLSEPTAAALAATVASALEDGSLRRAIGARGRAWMEQTMDLERILDRYAALYRELAGSAGSPAGAVGSSLNSCGGADRP